jgi:hypothetical protein
MTPRRWLQVLFGAWLCLALTARAEAQTGSPRELAKAHFASGEAKYKAGDYEGAIADFMAADALVPSPILAFNIALCHEKLGRLEDAIRLYNDYMGRRPDAPNRAAVESKIAELQRQIEAKKAPPPPPEPEQPTPPVDEGEIGRVLDEADPTPPPEPEATPPVPPRRYDEAFARRVPDRRAGAATYEGGAPVVAGGQAEQAPRPADPPPPAPEPERKSTPVYKQWWFWVLVGVSALILIDVATGDDEPSTSGSGAVILRF